MSGTVYEYRVYIYAINTGIPLLLVEKDDEGNSYNYLYSDRLLSRTGPQGSIYYHQDGLGSTTALSDISGKILNRYEYDAFGQPRSIKGKVDNRILFAGEMYDPSGLIYLRARYYDPVVGRFLTEDTLFGELDDPLSQNLYLYCANNPVVYVDPTGHMKVCQYDDMARGVVTSLGDTVRDLLAIPDVLAEFIEAISSGKISMKDLGQALGSSFAPVKHLAASSGRIWLGDPTDKEVYEYGRNMGATLQMIAGGGAAGAAAIKVISNAAPKLGKALARVAGARRATGKASVGELRQVAEFLKNKGLNATQRREVIEAFNLGAKVVKLEDDLVVYRYYGGAANPRGRWVTTEKLSDPVNQLALPPGSTAENVTRWIIPKGTEILQGTIAPNFGRPGGAVQIYIPDPNVLR